MIFNHSNWTTGPRPPEKQRQTIVYLEIHSQGFWPHLPIISRRDEVQPVFYHGRTKRQVETTLEGTAASASSKHIHDLTMAFDSRGQKFILDLKLNQNLIPKEYFHKYQTKVRQIVIPTKNYVI